jgi:hypothetical protein
VVVQKILFDDLVAEREGLNALGGSGSVPTERFRQSDSDVSSAHRRGETDGSSRSLQKACLLQEGEVNIV